MKQSLKIVQYFTIAIKNYQLTNNNNKNNNSNNIQYNDNTYNYSM